MQSSYLKALLAVWVMVPAIAQADGSNPFVPSSTGGTSSSIEKRLNELEQRTLQAEERLRDMGPGGQYPGLTPSEIAAGRASDPNAPGSGVVSGLSPQNRPIGMVNGKCLIRITSEDGTSRLTVSEPGAPCPPFN